MSKSQAYKHQLRALTRWPPDPLRPTIQFQDAIRQRLDRRLGLSRNASTPDTDAPQQPPTVPWDEASELLQANALYSLSDDRYARRYPLTRLLRPESNPSHYDDLIRELEAAPRRSWWGRVTNGWKGFLRFR